MSENKKLNRRSFLKLSAVTVLGAAVQACATSTPAPAPTATAKPAAPAATATSKPAAPAATNTTAPAAPAATATTKPAAPAATATTKPAEPTKPAAAPTSYKEAPMLAELVKAGKLPPVDQRLPTNPCVCPVIEGTGKYGGTLRRGFNGVSDGNGPRKLQEAGLAWYTTDTLALRPDLCEAWQMNANATEWTFQLRKGVKWSDGSPWDTDDFKWYYDYQFTNKTLTPAPGDFATGTPKVPMVMEFPDKYTVKFKFQHPYPLFPYRVTRTQQFVPRNYMKAFHIDTVADKAAFEKEYKDKKFDAWDKYYADRNNWVINPDRPNIGPWIGKNKMSDEIFVMERNPYFWQVDKDGNQLPYVDKITHRLFNTVDVFNLWVVNGEIDFQQRHVDLGNYTLFKDNETKGSYKLVLTKSVDCQVVVPNHTCKIPRVREFNQNRDVRIGLSYAINRKEVQDLVYNGLGTIRQYSPLSISPQSYPKLSNVHLDYDVKKANEYLDKAGYSKKGADGIRLWKDGSNEPISIIVESTSPAGSPAADEIEMVCKYFNAVGVKATHKPVERALYTQHFNANEIQWAVWSAGRTLFPILVPNTFLGTMYDIPWGLAWGFWETDPKNPAAEEPPQDHWFRKMWETWDKIAVEPDEQKRTQMFLQILDIWAVELPIIGIVGEVPSIHIVKNTLHNFKGGVPNDDTTRHESLIPTQTLYWEDPSKHV